MAALCAAKCHFNTKFVIAKFKLAFETKDSVLNFNTKFVIAKFYVFVIFKNFVPIISIQNLL